MAAQRVLILNQFFYPDISATSQLMTDLAEDLAREGLEVTALCSKGSYVGRGRLATSEMQGQVRIERVPVVSFDRSNIFRRIASYLTFYVMSFWRLLMLPRQDVIIVLTTPPLIAIVGYAIRALKGSKMICLVQDVYPDIAIEFGVLRRGSLAAKVFEGISRFLLRRADEVIVLGRCMQERVLAKGIEPGKLRVIPNWADGLQIRPMSRDSNPFLIEHGLTGKFVVLYSGNMGRAHDFTPIFAAMKRLADTKEIVFVFIGSGARRSELEAFLQKNPEVNAKVLDYVPREQLPFSMGAADIAIVAVADGLEGLVVPSKLYGIMASGRPPMYLGPPSSEAARAIKEHDCGWVVENRDVEGFVNAITGAYRDRLGAEELGRRARRAFELQFDRPLAAQKFLGSIRRVTKV